MHVMLALLSTYVGAQSDAISTAVGKGRHRVHCSLNINTETGRLSARRPNLQNQPALEKDRYKVRAQQAAPCAGSRDDIAVIRWAEYDMHAAHIHDGGAPCRLVS